MNSCVICGVNLSRELGNQWISLSCLGRVNLCYYLKIENISRLDQFQPISITNSDYQIVMRYWAKWLMESAREVISPEQNAIFAGRSIDNAVESIHDGFMEAVAEGKDMTILQTDFCKAYDYVNHEALMELLIGLNAPPQALEVVSKVL